jgi:hypothetical protein
MVTCASSCFGGMQFWTVALTRGGTGRPFSRPRGEVGLLFLVKASCCVHWVNIDLRRENAPDALEQESDASVTVEPVQTPPHMAVNWSWGGGHQDYGGMQVLLRVNCWCLVWCLCPECGQAPGQLVTGLGAAPSDGTTRLDRTCQVDFSSQMLTLGREPPAESNAHCA